LPRQHARILLFALLLATLVGVATGRRPHQQMPAPLQSSSIRSGMESPDFECRVDRGAPVQEGGQPEERFPLFGLAAPEFLLPLPGFFQAAPFRAAHLCLSATPLVTLLRARAPPVVWS